MARRLLPRLRVQMAAAALALVFAGSTLWLSSREPWAPPREEFSLFPMQFDQWRGQKDRIEERIVTSLKLDDYLLVNFRRRPDPAPVNLYVAYYKAQLLGSSAHSPRTCIPGGGWEIETLGRAAIKHSGSRRLAVNRAVIAKGRFKQLVYYWFEQRGRTLTGEYEVKWHLLVDAISTNRSDGALIRLVTPILNSDLEAADRRLGDFIGGFYPRMKPFVPS